MSNIVFQRGEILTAEKLNQLVQAVTGGAAVGDVVLGGGVPVQTHQLKQREFSSYLPPKHPVYIDQASPHWPLGDGQPGWFWRESSKPELTRLPVQPTAGQTLYLNTSFSHLGEVQRQELALLPGSNLPWYPWPCVAGYSSVALGTVQKDKFRAGALSETLRFFDAPATASPQMVFYSAPSTRVPFFSSFECVMPPGTYYAQYSLVTDSRSATKYFPALQSDGGMIFRETRNFELPELPERNVQLIPKFALRAAPSTEAPLTPSDEELWGVPRFGCWQPVASVWLNDVQLSLNMQWVNPWFAYVNLSTKSCSALTLIHQTWKRAWGVPNFPSLPDPFSVQANAWRVVSKSGPSIQVIDMEQFPAGCAWLMHEEVIMQAEGTGCAVVDSAGNVIAYQPVLFQAYLRRQLAPTTGCWCVWYDECWTQTPWN